MSSLVGSTVAPGGNITQVTNDRGVNRELSRLLHWQPSVQTKKKKTPYQPEIAHPSARSTSSCAPTCLARLCAFSREEDYRTHCRFLPA